MIEYILIISAFVLAVSGLAELLHFLRLLLCRPKKQKNIYSLVLLKSGDAVNQLNFALAQQKWYGSFYADKIIAVNDGLSESELECCRSITDCENAVICNSDALLDVILDV